MEEDAATREEPLAVLEKSHSPEFYTPHPSFGAVESPAPWSHNLGIPTRPSQTVSPSRPAFVISWGQEIPQEMFWGGRVFITFLRGRIVIINFCMLIRGIRLAVVHLQVYICMYCLSLTIMNENILKHSLSSLLSHLLLIWKYSIKPLSILSQPLRLPNYNDSLVFWSASFGRVLG